jgi:hypothetical protein
VTLVLPADPDPVADAAVPVLVVGGDAVVLVWGV